MKTLYGLQAAMRTLVAAAWVSFACLLQNSVGMDAFAASTTHTIVVENMKFVPENLTVKPGDSVVWVNKDFFPHTATAQHKSFDSGDIAANKSWKLVAAKKGAFPYVCTLHPTMKATLIVQ